MQGADDLNLTFARYSIDMLARRLALFDMFVLVCPSGELFGRFPKENDRKHTIRIKRNGQI